MLAHIYTAFLTAELLSVAEFKPPFDNYWYWSSSSNTAESVCENCIKYLENTSIIAKCDDIKETFTYLYELYSLDLAEILNRI